MLFNLKGVNAFLVMLHAKANLTTEGALLQKENTRLSNAAAKARQSRSSQEKVAKAKSDKDILDQLEEKATLADIVVVRAQECVGTPLIRSFMRCL